MNSERMLPRRTPDLYSRLTRLKQRSVMAFFLGGLSMTLVALILPTTNAPNAAWGIGLFLVSLLLGSVQVLLVKRQMERGTRVDGPLMLLGNACVVTAALGETYRFGSQVSAQMVLWPMVFAPGFLERRWWPWQAALSVVSLFTLAFVKAEVMGGDARWWIGALVVSVTVLVTGLVVGYFRLAAEHEAEALAHHSLTDPLTGLLNRRALPEKFRQLLDAVPPGHQVALVMVDLDYFKRVNDQFGHPAGDQVLQTLSQVLRQSAHPAHLLARMGGEEFLWVLHGPASQHLHDQVEEARQVVGRSPDMRGTTLSAGVVTRARAALTPEHWSELLTLADRALYRAKDEGRNRICHA